MKVRDPDGETWRVSRRWVPWRRRLKGAMDGIPDLGMGSLGDDPISMVIGLVLLVVLLPFLLLFLVAGVELLALLAVLPLAILGRVLLGRHWTVEVRHRWTPWWETRSGDWGASGLQIHDIARAIERGERPPRTLGESVRP
ncbi:MAG: hypothetical protein ABWX84_06080 [Nocardioides sp.]